jgi:hypothetical protein
VLLDGRWSARIRTTCRFTHQRLLVDRAAQSLANVLGASVKSAFLRQDEASLREPS